MDVLEVIKVQICMFVDLVGVTYLVQDRPKMDVPESLSIMSQIIDWASHETWWARNYSFVDCYESKNKYGWV